MAKLPELPKEKPIATRFGRSGLWVWELTIWRYPDGRYCYAMKVNHQMVFSDSVRYPLFFGSYRTAEEAIAHGLEDVYKRLEDAPFSKRRR